MAARKRKHNESFKKYRVKLKKEHERLKIRLRGSVLWPSEWGTAVLTTYKGLKCLTNGKQMVRA